MRLSFRNDTPLIEVWDDAFTKAEANQVIEWAMPRLEHSRVVDFESRGDVLDDNTRTSMDMFFTIDEVVEKIDFFLPIMLKLQDISGIPFTHYEQPTVLRYEPGQQYYPHMDSYPEDKYEDRRIGTFLLYLNDTDGGETEFTRLGIKVFPKVGRILYFDYNTNDNLILESTMHAGRSPNTGVKWVMTVWVTFKELFTEKDLFGAYR